VFGVVDRGFWAEFVNLWPS